MCSWVCWQQQVALKIWVVLVLITDCCCRVVSTLLRLREVPGSDLAQKTGYLGQGLSWCVCSSTQLRSYLNKKSSGSGPENRD